MINKKDRARLWGYLYSIEIYKLLYSELLNVQTGWQPDIGVPMVRNKLAV